MAEKLTILAAPCQAQLSSLPSPLPAYLPTHPIQQSITPKRAVVRSLGSPSVTKEPTAQVIRRQAKEAGREILA